MPERDITPIRERAYDALPEPLVVLWDDLHYPHKRMALRRFACSLGLHWKITFWDCGGSYFSPPDDGWACEQCGHERLPYRAFLWRIPLVRRWVP
jgi:hypothetical protein